MSRLETSRTRFSPPSHAQLHRVCARIGLAVRVDPVAGAGELALRQEALHVLTDHLVCGEADGLEERVVRGRDPPARIRDDDHLAGVLEQVAIAPLAGAQGVLEIAFASYVAADAEDERDLSTLVADRHRGRLDSPPAAVGVAHRPVQETGSPAARAQRCGHAASRSVGVDELAHRAADKVVRLVAERGS